MSRRISIGILAASVLCVSLETRARADVPSFLTQQGRLFDSMNNPVTGMTTFVFSIYSAATAGTPVWTETQMITLDSGYFSAQLGEVTALAPTIFVNAASMSQTLYLGIKVNADPELSPRQPLLSVPYAMVASNAIGDITPHTVSVNGKTVIDSMGNWVGPTMGGGHPVMASGATPAPAQGASLAVSQPAASIGNHLWPVTLTTSQLGSATSCAVTATGNICGHPQLTTQTYAAVYASIRTTGNTTTATDSNEGAWFPAPLINTGMNTYTCSATTVSYTFTVAPGTSYDFGCGYTTSLAIPGNPTDPAGGAYCTASVICF